MRWTARHLVGLRVPTEVTISLDGATVAAVVTEPDWDAGVTLAHLWLWRAKEGVFRQWTFGNETVTQPRFSPDGKWLAFLARRARDAEQDAGDKREPPTQLWLLPLDGGEAQRLTDADKGVVTFAWAPDGTALYAVVPEPEPAERARAAETERRRRADYTYHDDALPPRAIWRFRLPDGAGEKVWVGDAGVYEIAIAPDGMRCVLATTGTGKADDWRRSKLFWLALNEMPPTPRTLCDRQGAQTMPRCSPNGNAVAFLSWREPDRSFSHKRIFVADLEGNWSELMPLPDLEVDALHWARNGLWCILQTTATSQVWQLGETAATPLSDADWVIAAMDVTLDGHLCVAIRTDDLHPPEVWLGKLDGGRLWWTQLSDFNPQVRRWTLPTAHLVQWRSDDGVTIDGVLWLPSQETLPPSRPHPTVVWVHGGPKSRATKALLAAMGLPAFLAAHGYAVLAPNYRGSSGSDNAFATANFCDLGGGDFRDILAGVEWCIAQGIADPDRIGIAGGSYGGYMTHWALTQTERFKAGVSFYGIALLFSDFGNSEIPSWEPDYLGGLPWDAPDLYLQRSPLVHAHRITAPLLLLHGESDRNTFISNSQELFTALKKLGQTVEFVRYPREGHGFNEPHHRLDALERTLRWFDRWLRGDAFANAAPLGEHERDDTLAVCVPEPAHPIYPVNEQRRDSETVVVVAVCVQALKDGVRLTLADAVRLLDDNGRAHPAMGFVQTMDNGRCFVVEGDLSVNLPVNDVVSLPLAFRLPTDRAPAAIWLHGLTVRCR